MKWIKNTKGNPDAMLTFATISFLVVTFNILLSTLGHFELNELKFSFSSMDSGTMTAYLAATFGAYVTRRWTDARPNAENKTDA
jgi:hypothetical protein